MVRNQRLRNRYIEAQRMVVRSEEVMREVDTAVSVEEIAQAEVRARPGPHLVWTLLIASIAYCLVVLDYLVVVTALPSAQRELHVGLPTLQWAVNSYGITLAAGILISASFGDRWGRRRLFALGLAIFTAASAACALAPGAWELIAARAIQGLGGAVVLPLSLTILTEAFPVKRRGAIVGVYTGIAGVAVAIAPLLGGFITQALGWHWVFWINVPLGGVAFVLALRLIAESYGAAEPLDLLGVGLITAGVTALVWALVRANDAGWASGEVAGSIVVGIALVAAFFFWEARAANPMLPLKLLRSPVFAAGNVTSLLIGATIAAPFFIVQYFQFGLGYSPFNSGLRLLPYFITPAIFAPVAGALLARIGSRVMAVAGLGLQAVGLVAVVVLVGEHSSYVPLAVALFVSGIGSSIEIPPVQVAVINAVAPEQIGKASGVFTTLLRFGTVFGIALGTALFVQVGNLRSPGAVGSGTQWALALFVVISLLAGVAGALLPGRATERTELR
jgi:EmrB/QacA subfamily drug resistance transporter